MQQQDLASWIRKEHDHVEQLADRLRERVAIIPHVGSEGWIRDTRDRYEHFRAHLQRHMALEEKEGYMEAVLERRPTLSERVERLAQEHRDLARLLDDLHKLAMDLEPDRRLFLRDFCHRVQVLLSYVEHHEDEENDLIGLVFSEDIGTND